MKYIIFLILWLIGTFIINDPRILWGVTFLIMASQIYILFDSQEH